MQRRLTKLAGYATFLVCGLLCLAPPVFGHPAPRLIVWAWERPEDLRFLPSGVEVAAQTGFLEISGDRLVGRGRRSVLLTRPGAVTTAVVHVQIDHRQPLKPTPELVKRLAKAVLAYGLRSGAGRMQLDFEVRASERPFLLLVLRDIRDGLPLGVGLSMTALASWCDTESWLAEAPVDEVVPMLFRMGAQGGRIKARLARGDDFTSPECVKALAISTDTPILNLPVRRRIYLFNPHSWTAAAFAAQQELVGQ